MNCTLSLSLRSGNLWARKAGILLRSDLRAFSGRVDMAADKPCPGVSIWPSLPWQGNLRNMENLPTLSELRELLCMAMSAVSFYQESHPTVQNLNKLTTRIKRDLNFLESQQKLLEKQTSVISEPQLDAGSLLGGLAEGRLQGIVNNLRGLHGELLALHEAPGVIAVCSKFRTTLPRKQSSRAVRAASQPATAITNDSTEQHVCRSLPASGYRDRGRQTTWRTAAAVHGSSSEDSWNESDDEVAGTVQRSSLTAEGSSTSSVIGLEPAARASAPAGAPPASSPLCVEVDIVANGGSTWIEVKNQERFGVDSIHWLGSPGHGKGLAQQVADLQAVAAAPINHIRWRAPDIVVYFPSGVDEGVAAALRDQGVKVAVGPGSLSSLSAPPPAPKTTNLDVTTLCALVSEVSWGDPSSSAMQQWAARTVHWKDCVAAQIASPILIELHACLDDTQQLVASCAAIHQFQKLVDMIAGPREQQRWLELQQRLQVYHCSDSNSIDSGGRCTACGSDLTQGSVALSAASETASADGQVTAATRQMQDNTVSDVLFDIAAQQPLLAQQLQQPQPLQTYRQPERMRHLDKLTDQQRAILGLGDALEAITVTANGNAVRYCEQQGVKLEVLMHRPVWLTGL